jgi:hypothetical protein
MMINQNIILKNHGDGYWTFFISDKELYELYRKYNGKVNIKISRPIEQENMKKKYLKKSI